MKTRRSITSTLAIAAAVGLAGFALGCEDEPLAPQTPAENPPQDPAERTPENGDATNNEGLGGGYQAPESDGDSGSNIGGTGTGTGGPGGVREGGGVGGTDDTAAPQDDMDWDDPLAD